MLPLITRSPDQASLQSCDGVICHRQWVVDGLVRKYWNRGFPEIPWATQRWGSSVVSLVSLGAVSLDNVDGG